MAQWRESRRDDSDPPIPYNPQRRYLCALGRSRCPVRHANGLATKIAGSHAHAARNHQEFVRGKVANLFKHTPDDKQINFVKE